MTRVVLFGASGFTGSLTAQALMRRGITPVLAGRSADRLASLVTQLHHDYGRICPIQTADSADLASVRRLVEDTADVLVTTVGPFASHGAAALHAAIGAGCGYLDSTGEPPFIKDVFERADGPAKRSGARLLTAFGYDYIPGNLAGTIALDQARAAGVRIDRIEIGYFIRGGFGISSGTKASALGMLLEPSFAYRRGRLVSVPTARAVQTFIVAGRTLDALSIGGSEHFTLPALDTNLRSVDVYLGWAGEATKAAQFGSVALNGLARIPGTARTLRTLTARFAPTGSGPAAEERAKAATVAIARTFDAADAPINEVVVEGPSPYDLTAELLAWGAQQLAERRDVPSGALGPAEAFGARDFVEGCAAIGLAERT